MASAGTLDLNSGFLGMMFLEERASITFTCLGLLVTGGGFTSSECHKV